MASERLCKDWISTYLQYVDNSEPPISYHTWTAVATIAAVLQRKVWLHWGLQADIYPNFYITLVGPPGARKGTAMKIGKKMLQEIGVNLGSDCITRAALCDELLSTKSKFSFTDHHGECYEIEHESLSVFAEEMAVFIGEQNPDMIITLTDLFDSPSTWSYSTRKKGKQAMENIWLNILGAITPSLLHAKLTRETIGSGLVSRMIFVVEMNKRKHAPFPFPTKEEIALREDLLADLELIKELSGPYRMTKEAMAEYGIWYKNPKSSQAVPDERFAGYNERRALHVRKLAMVFSASRGSDKIITLEDFNRALTLLESAEENMPRAFFGVGRASHADLMSEVISVIEKEKCISFTKLLSRFKTDTTIEELMGILTILEQTQVVTRRLEDGDKQFYSIRDGWQDFHKLK